MQKPATRKPAQSRRAYKEHRLAQTVQARKDLKALAEWLRELRASRGLTLEQVAHAARCSVNQIHNIEAARNWASSLRPRLARMAAAPARNSAMPTVVALISIIDTPVCVPSRTLRGTLISARIRRSPAPIGRPPSSSSSSETPRLTI